MIDIEKNPRDINEREIMHRWQRSLSLLLLSIIFVVFICEVGFLVYFQAYNPQVLAVSTDQYIVKYVLYPTISNLAVFAVWQFSLLRNHSEETQAWITLIGFILILSNIQRTHYVFPVTYALLMIPLILSVFYGSHKITNTTCAMAMCVYLTTIMSIYMTCRDNLPELFLNNVVIGLVMIPLASLLVNSIIDRGHEQIELIAMDPEGAKKHGMSSKDEQTDLLNGEGILARLKRASGRNERIGFIVVNLDEYDPEDERALIEVLKIENTALDILARFDSGCFAWIIQNPDQEDIKLRLESLKLEFDRAMMKTGHNTTISVVYQVVENDFDVGHILSATAKLLNEAALRGGDLILSGRKQ